MDDIRSGKVKAALFLFFIVVLVVGGYIGMILLTKENNDTPKREVATKNSKDEGQDIRIDNSKDYIYFENEVIKNETRDIIYQDVVFNFDTNDAKTVKTLLNDERKTYEDTYKLIKDVELTEEEKETVLFKESDIYAATYNKYTTHFYKNYATIISNTYSYHCTTGSKNIKNKAYVFDISTGNLLSNEKLTRDFELNLAKIKEIVKEKLEKEQTIIEGIAQIDITGTLASLDDEKNYALYVNKNGYLVISYFIKNVQDDYNDVIILN